MVEAEGSQQQPHLRGVKGLMRLGCDSCAVSGAEFGVCDDKVEGKQNRKESGCGFWSPASGSGDATRL